MDKKSQSWKQFPVGLKWLFALNVFWFRPTRKSVRNVELTSHLFGFLFCVLGLINEPAQQGGIILLCNAYFFRLHIWLGDSYGAWYDAGDPSKQSNTSA